MQVLMYNWDVCHIYLVSYATIGSEYKQTWGWFIELIIKFLNIGSEEGWAFISDDHLGSIFIINELTLLLEYRHYA